MAKIRVLLVDDHTLFRDSLRSLLERSNNIEVVGEAESGVGAIDQAVQLAPDVVLMDIAMSNVNGLQATRRIKKRNPSIKILALTMYETEQHIREMLCAGASGYVSKRAPARELISGIETVYRGNAILSSPVARKVVDEYVEQIKIEKKEGKSQRLTARELEILSLIAEGKSNKEIAELLSLSVSTVQTHRLHLMRKLGAHDCTHLVRYAIREGLIVP
jgi:DNA-binding NarL/FixJ family response regulator